MTEQAYLHMHNWWRFFIMFCYSIICFAIWSDKIWCISSLSMHGNEINHFRRKNCICNILYQFRVVFLWTVKNRNFDFTCIAFQNVSWQLLWELHIFYISLFFRFNNSHLYYKFWKLMNYSTENDQNKINFGSNACLFQRSLMTHKYLKLIFYHSVDAG